MATADGCSPCHLGKYNTGGNKPDCFLCKPGRYEDQTGDNVVANSDFECKNCQAGKTSKPIGQTSEDTCEDCPKGTYSELTGVFGKCENCGRGKWSENTGLDSERKCTVCSVGYYADTVGRVDDCIACAPGRANANTANHIPCYECKMGKFGHDYALVFCEVCPGGESFFQSVCEAAGIAKAQTGCFRLALCALCALPGSFEFEISLLIIFFLFIFFVFVIQPCSLFVLVWPQAFTQTSWNAKRAKRAILDTTRTTLG